MTEHTQPTFKQAASTGLRIYVACLAAYNNGYLHGRWIDANQDPEAIQAEISAMLQTSPIPGAEEWAIHDHEGFDGVELHEYSGIDRVVALAAFIAERGELGAKVLEHFGGDIDQAEAAFDEYAGRYRSLADFVQEITEETTDIPPTLIHYIDYAAMARDLELNGDVFTVELGFEDVHVFWSR
ncbi:antirestriction protein ArdA [Chelativorans sp. M5D2P16]|uniref:antirestriction protein ArdA n=1 Tax=Chelativorans sp. M5D2P16 TaxID=3095678 RepID=UPI002ACACB91|nr:antirestriction protein ArdA [Chelativorans sp. M5D2P16]MDZ5696738.1 antirestriction protein ArdA [Chelativorans sp. M5D2P16]